MYMPGPNFYLISSSLAVLKVVFPVSQVAVPSGVVEDVVWSVGCPVIPPFVRQAAGVYLHQFNQMP